MCSLTEFEPRVDQELERKEKEMLENTLTTTTTAKEEHDGKSSAKEASDNVVVKEEIFEEFRKITENEEDVERLRAFLNTPGVRRGTDPSIYVPDGSDGKNGIIEPLVLAPSRDKEHRKQLHTFFRQFQLETDSVTLDNECPNATNGQNLCISKAPILGEEHYPTTKRETRETTRITKTTSETKK